MLNTNLYGGLGMGSAGTGAGQSPMVPFQNATPQQLMMLRAMLGAGGPVPAPGPMAAPQVGGPVPGGGATPMSNYIGATAGGGVPMPHVPPMMPSAQPQGGTPAPGSAPAVSPAVMQLMQMLQKGGQTGVTPPNGPTAPFSWLGNLMQGYTPGGMPGSNVLGALGQQADSNIQTAGPY